MRLSFVCLCIYVQLHSVMGLRCVLQGALDTACGLEVLIDAPGAAGVVVEGVAREPQPLLYAAVLVP